MSIPTPDPPEVWVYPNQWFILICVLILLGIWFSGPLLRLVDRLRK